MKRQLLYVVLCFLLGLVTIGARGCEIVAETDADSYEIASQGLATITNQSDEQVYLPGCSVLSLEKLEEDGWVNRGPHVTCIWEGIGVPLPPGESLDTEFFVPSELGTWRVHYVVSLGCDEGVPLSQANCDREKDVYTGAFEVVPQENPSCVDLGGSDFGVCEMLLGWAVMNGSCAKVSGCDGGGFQFFADEKECSNACSVDKD